ncbi:MAG: glycosyltransferase [Christiangramia sp.]|uniref:glycosyltransferase n=1 Tax=Christiangramia sp. TaxID=1931228 RepID=UPI003242BC1E
MDFYNKSILLVLHQGALGGAERQGLGLSRMLTEKYNCRVNLLLTYSEKTTVEFEKFSQECHIENIIFVERPYLICKYEISWMNLKRFIWSVKYLLKLKKSLSQYQPDIIIPFLNFPSKVSYYLYMLLPEVSVTFWHQLGFDTNSRDIFERIAAKNTPFVISNAPNGLEMFRKIYKRPESKLNVLPQYVSLDYAKMNREALKNKFQIPHDHLVIGMIAHYREEKYHDLLLGSFIKLNNSFKKICLVFLGNRDNTPATIAKFDSLAEKIEKFNFKKKIRLLHNEDVKEVLNVMDIGVLVSRIEGTPNAVMEYMLYGLPVICTAHPGCELLLKGSSFLIKNDPDQLTDSLEKLIISDSLRREEGLKNKERIRAYNRENYMDKLNEIINKYQK